MAEPSSVVAAVSDDLDSSLPLLRSVNGDRTSALARLLSRATGRRGASSLVRETAAMQLEERRADWGFSKPVVALDISWNLAFAVVSVVMLASTLREDPNVPIRVWICGYALQCVIHVVFVWSEYRRRRRRGVGGSDDGGRGSDSEGNDSEDEGGDGGGGYGRIRSRSTFAKRCESINTLASFLWWIVGFYWVVSGGEALEQNAPRLYWLSVVFLAFDVFFAIFCIALACMIGIALCCCLPCIIAILYAVAGQEGATESDISMLSRYKYNVQGNDEKPSAGLMVPIGGEYADQRVLLPEDAECCICLSSYDDGSELHALPCGHHFHAPCIVKWLKINASCPLCKYNILKGNNSQV
ncbi:hypothetical protein Scep_022734 [Stephania cephalantha]|uniref:RING-type E3 ubiquitin transferase n=1 Tax=Stephania cephalantha TaxID=152367 RepID=A0AAP0F8I4_9MAGN